MPERAGDTETVRAGTPLRVGETTLLPIERVVLSSHRTAHGGWVTAAVEPYALVVLAAGRVRVLEVGGEAVSLRELRRRIPGLDALLAAGGG